MNLEGFRRLVLRTLWTRILVLFVLLFVGAVIIVLLVGCTPTPTPTTSPLPTPISPLPTPVQQVSPTITLLPLSSMEGTNRVIGPREYSTQGDNQMDFTEMLAVALFLSVIANRLIEALIVPLFDRFKIDKFWLQYISWGVGAGLVGLSGVNLFVKYVPSTVVGLALTAIVCGGGANFINDIFTPNYLLGELEEVVDEPEAALVNLPTDPGSFYGPPINED